MGKRFFGLVFGGIWLAVGLPFLIIGIVSAFHEHSFENEARYTDGMVLTKYIRRASKSNSTQYRITYRFEAHNGDTFEGDCQVDVHQWERLEERGPIRVSYLASNPRSNRVSGSSDWAFPLIFGILGGVFSISGGIIFFRSLIGFLTDRRLAGTGIPCEARVTEVGPTHVSINRRPQWRVHYEYRDMMGQTHQGRSGYLSEQEASEWQAGRSTQIKYDQNKPAKSVWLGRS